MYRSEFGDWGRDLGETSFWQAVAILGLMTAIRGSPPGAPDDPGPWFEQVVSSLPTGRRLSDEPGPGWMVANDELAAARDGRLMPASQLAPWWPELTATQRLPPRLQSFVLFDNEFEFAATLHRHLGVSIYHNLPAVSSAEDWQWPLRVAMPGDQRYETLRNHLENLRGFSPTMRRLIRQSRLGDHPVVEFLILSNGIEAALQQLEGAPIPIRAHCLLVVGSQPVAPAQATFATTERLQRLAMAKGVVVSPVQDGEFKSWIDSLVRHLSHDEPLDFALRRASGVPPTMFFDPAIFRLARMGAFADKATSALTLAGQSPIGLDQEEGNPIGMVAGSYAADEVARRLAATLRDPAAFDQERRAATWTTNLVRAAERSGTLQEARLQRHQARAPDDGRRVQLTVSDEDGRTHYFRAGREHEIALFIGTDGGMLSGSPFPDESLPGDEAGHLLTVTLFAPGFLERPRLETIYLPRMGPSTECQFRLAIGSDRPLFEARLSIAYLNRVLQTYLLRGSVIGSPDADDQAIDLLPEMATQPGWIGLEAQRPYGASIVLNRLADEKSMTLQVGYRVLGFSIEGLGDETTIIESKIDASKWDAPDMRGLSAEGTRFLVHFLAKHGASLWSVVERHATSDDAGRQLIANLAKADVVQVMAANLGARLPIEFFYSNPSPNDDATICPFHEKGVADRDCEQCPHRDASHFCPAGLWSLSKMIEWHDFEQTKQRLAEFAPREFALQAVDEKFRRDQLRPITDVVIGFSQAAGRVDPKCVPAMIDKIKRLNVAVHVAANWDDLEKKLKKVAPALVVLLAHLHKNKFEQECLEIWGTSRNAEAIGRLNLGTPPGQPGPIVLLIGCNTDNAGVPFRSFPVKFSPRASVVIATISHVLGRHAAPLAGDLCEALIESQRTGMQTFSQVMRIIRRRGLREGVPPISLALKSYGDARWRC